MSAHAIDKQGTVYTAVSVGYDKKPLAFTPEPNVLIDLRIATADVNGTLWNREQKIIKPPQTGLWSVYLDGSLTPKGEVRADVESWLANHDMALFKHPWRTCAYAEIDECVARGKLESREAEKCRSHLRLAGFPRDFGLWACGMIARRVHCNALQMFAAPLWWDMVQHVPRDQIWLPYILWKLKDSAKRLKTIDKDIYNNKFLSFRRHGK